jgi:hypothetical protein
MDARVTPAGPVSAPPRRRRSLLVALSGGLVLVALGVLPLGVVGLVRGTDDPVGTASDAAPAAAAVAAPAPAALSVRVAAPGPAVAGQPVRLAVTYADGRGIFSGSTEDWGDGVGASSLAEDRCSPTAAAPGQVTGSYRATHTFARPGHYTVRIAVSSYTCDGTEPVEEQATTTVTVEVAAS